MGKIWVIGAGLTGATIARCLKDAGHDVVIFEARDRVAGNCYDDIQRGCLINAHGPHYFRTNSDAIFSFASRFATWRPWTAHVQTRIDGELYPWPISTKTIAHFCGSDWRSSLYTGPIHNFEEACLAKVPERIYRLFVQGYTEKQWGTPAHLLSAKLAARFEPREGDDTRFMLHRFQALPEGGYTQWITNMIGDIPVERNVRLTAVDLQGCAVFSTAAIDECFDYCFGRLRYRHQKRVTSWSTNHVHSVPQVNDPNPSHAAIREIDWGWMQSKHQAEYAVTTETPAEALMPGNLEYPYPDQENAYLNARYAAHAADVLPEVVFCGRLGEYRYYDMDQAIGAGKSIVRRWLG